MSLQYYLNWSLNLQSDGTSTVIVVDIQSAPIVYSGLNGVTPFNPITAEAASVINLSAPGGPGVAVTGTLSREGRTLTLTFANSYPIGPIPVTGTFLFDA